LIITDGSGGHLSNKIVLCFGNPITDGRSGGLLQIRLSLSERERNAFIKNNTANAQMLDYKELLRRKGTDNE
jgi:hypothetical protein